MNEPGISLRRFGYDDECWKVEVTASNGRFAATFDFYTHPMELAPFAEALLTFPRDVHDEAKFEQGAHSSEPAYHLLIRSFLYDGPGHSAIEFAVHDHPARRFTPSAHFYVPAEAAAINRLGQKLLRWLQCADEPLSWRANPLPANLNS
ncbi:MAG: hypothetical protein V4726_13830 [Verrucomicrobiota bacterium]